MVGVNVVILAFDIGNLNFNKMSVFRRKIRNKQKQPSNQNTDNFFFKNLL